MAIEARMNATEVRKMGGGRWVACGPDAEGAKSLDEWAGTYYYGAPPWLASAEFVRLDPNQQSQEIVSLVAVSAKGQDDPNREWALASPSGNFTISIDNPAAWGYVEAGGVYRVTVERIRGPRTPSDG